MPPKPKYTKEQISQMAFDIVRTNGISKLTARELGKYMGTSPTPIFSVFEDMEELTRDVFTKAKACFESYLSVPGDSPRAYESRVYQCVKFAHDEPQLFKLLFLNEKENNVGFAFGMDTLSRYFAIDIAAIVRDSGMSEKDASETVTNTYFNAYAYCTLIALNCCPLSMDAIRTRLLKSLSGASGAF